MSEMKKIDWQVLIAKLLELFPWLAKLVKNEPMAASSCPSECCCECIEATIDALVVALAHQCHLLKACKPCDPCE